jgi:hypothetical protein
MGTTDPSDLTDAHYPEIIRRGRSLDIAATPAASAGTLFFRTQGHVVAIGQ